jgi:tRNA(His) 5'-end guanylyltransferase
MKEYEAVTLFVLPRRTYTILRVDGRAFHTYLRDAEKPFDMSFVADMGSVAQALCEEITGTVFAYAQSDEISLLITDFGRPDTQPWFGGVVQKMVSVAASVATARLNQMRPSGSTALFDARVYTIPDPVEVANYFLWRQRDTVRNSISMAAQAHFSHKELQGVNGGEMQDMLFTQKNINWNDYPDSTKRGRVCTREVYITDVTYTDGRTQEEVTVAAQRSRWVMQDAPHFTSNPLEWLATMVKQDMEIS